VLDPFCGVGTMLIERQKVVKGNTSYGIDTFAEAIRKAKINTEAAGQIIHFVNKNCLEFTHEYSFDEIFTNMPFATGHKSQDEIYEIYEAFFPKAKEWLVPGGTIIMYTHNRDYALLLAQKHGYKIIEEFEIMDKEGTYLLIIK
ncbi:MAG: methyltransferase, partial [Lachnospiraceae bacterium]